MTPLQFTKALALTESNGNPAAWGDDGLAMGAWQVHPAWVWDHCKLVPQIDESWNDWIERNIEAFFNDHIFLPAVEIAMFFHIGHRVLPDESDWDAPYAKRFIGNCK